MQQHIANGCADTTNTKLRWRQTYQQIASQQRPHTSSILFKSTMTNTLFFDGKKENFELLENLFQTVLIMHP